MAGFRYLVWWRWRWPIGCARPTTEKQEIKCWSFFIWVREAWVARICFAAIYILNFLIMWKNRPMFLKPWNIIRKKIGTFQSWKRLSSMRQNFMHAIGIIFSFFKYWTNEKILKNETKLKNQQPLTTKIPVSDSMHWITYRNLCNVQKFVKLKWEEFFCWGFLNKLRKMRALCSKCHFGKMDRWNQIFWFQHCL